MSADLAGLLAQAKPLLPVPLAPIMPQKGIFLSLFGGAGLVAQSWCDGGREALLIDLWDSPANDLSTDVAGFSVDRLLQKRCNITDMPLIRLLGMEPVCASWSRARGGGRGPPAIRSKEHLLGLPGVRPHDQKKLDDGNRQLEQCKRWIGTALAHGVAGYLEAPANSWIWQLEWLRQLQESGRAARFLLDQCQYGCPYRKTTGLLLWGLSKPQTLKFRRCHMRHGACSATGGRHLVLQGLDPETGSFRTSQTQVYPPAMAVDMASQLANASL